MKPGDLVQYIGGKVLWMDGADPTRQPMGLGTVLEANKLDVWVYWSSEEMYFWHAREELEVIDG